MQIDPLVAWQRLTDTYGQMYDEQLLDLAADPDALTEQARQVLADEMKKRGLKLPPASGYLAQIPSLIPDQVIPRDSTAFGSLARIPDLVQDSAEFGEATESVRDYTWKTPLCTCETGEEAWQICEVLRRAGIESWIDGPRGSYSPYSPELDVRTPRILVAADQLEQARDLANRPIPQEIIEQSQMKAPEFEAPVCPKCGAADPLLESVDPVNTWLCEACEHEWTESASGLPEDPS